MCGRCKGIEASLLSNLYWVQEDCPEHAVVAPTIARLSSRNALRRNVAAIERAGLTADDRILEIGCNAGVLQGILRHPGFVGVDLRPDFVRRARVICPDGLFAVADATALPFPDGTFSKLFSLDVMEHIPVHLLSSYAAEVARVAAPGARFLLSTPNGSLNIIKRAFGRVVEAAHETEFAPEEVEALWASVGFALECSAKLDDDLFPSGLVWRGLQMVLSDSDAMVTAATKVTKKAGYVNQLYVFTKVQR